MKNKDHQTNDNQNNDQINQNYNQEDLNNDHNNQRKDRNQNEKKERNEDKWTCPICFDKLQSPVVTQCGHVFCYDCIDHWLLRSNKCPMCNKPINRNELIVVPGHGETNNIGTRERRERSKWNINIPQNQKQKIIFVVLIVIFIFILFQ